MANYSLVINSKFRPFSFEEYIKPYQMYGEAYHEIENALGELDTKANIWENMANEQTDRETYKIYKKYADDLKEQRDQLYKEGLNSISRKGLLDMRTRYGKEITPIENAYAARAKEAETQYAGKAQGMVYEGDASTSSLDRYLKNPNIKYGQANSKEGFNRVATVAQALSKSLMNYGKGKALDNFTSTWLQEHGYKDTDVAAAIADIQKIMTGDTNVETNGVLRNILNDEMKVSGVNKWEDVNARLDYFNRVAPALYQSVGQTQVSPFENYGNRLAAQEANQKRIARYNKSLEKSSKTEESKGLNPRHWAGLLGKQTSMEGYKNLLKKLTNNGKGLKPSYFGKKFINPIKVYEEAVAYAKKHPVKKSAANKFIFTQMYPGVIDYSFENAINVMKEKYGITNVLTKSDYNHLKALGFNKNSKFTDMYSNNIAKKIDETLPIYRPSAINSGNIDRASELIMGNLKLLGDNNKLYDIINKEVVKYKDIEGKEIDDIAYSQLYKGKLLISIGGKKIAIPANAYSADAEVLINNYENMIDSPYVTNAQKAELQDLLSYELEDLMNSWNKSRSKTDNKR